MTSNAKLAIFIGGIGATGWMLAKGVPGVGAGHLPNCANIGLACGVQSVPVSNRSDFSTQRPPGVTPPGPQCQCKPQAYRGFFSR